MRSVAYEVPGGPPAARIARHKVLGALDDLLAPDERGDIELLLSELVTNCVRHAGMVQESDRIKVNAVIAPERIRLEVRDTGPGFGPAVPKVRSYEDGAGGLGLVLLERLSEAWGVAAEDEFCVWAELRRAAEDASLTHGQNGPRYEAASRQ